MALTCPFQRPAETETACSQPDADRESELVAIFAAAEMAFDQVCRVREGVGA
jgi:hypothetical protein